MPKKKNQKVVESDMQVNAVVENVVSTETISNYQSIEWLHDNEARFVDGQTSSKFNPEREPLIVAGLEQIEKIAPEFPKSLLVLAKWWENKAVRSEIKKLIDAEAVAKGIDPVHYMQTTLREAINPFDGLQEAVNRLKYAITYFKPRGGVKDTFKLVNISGKIYNVNLRIMSELKEKYANDKATLIKELIAVSNEIEAAEEL